MAETRPARVPHRHPRLERELRTVRAMIDIYCDAHHRGADQRCPDCEELLAYAEKRLAGCLFQERKPTCGACPVHCYKPSMRAKIKEVMRFSGPKMVLHHPLLALRHLLDERRQAPASPPSKKTTTKSP